MTRLVALAVVAMLLAGCAAEVDPLIEDERDSAWETYVFLAGTDAAERPDVPIVEIVKSGDENAKWAECLADAGYEVTLDEDGTGLSLEEGDDALLALYICKASYPYDPKTMTGWPSG